MAEMMMIKKMQDCITSIVNNFYSRWSRPAPQPDAKVITTLAERRRLKRLGEDSIGCLVATGEETHGQQMRLLDISDQGVRLVSSARLTMNQRAQCTVATRSRNVTFPIQVMWVRRHDDVYEYGARFIRQRGAANVDLDMFIACRFVEVTALAG
jgi:hypothetical protein